MNRSCPSTRYLFYIRVAPVDPPSPAAYSTHTRLSHDRYWYNYLTNKWFVEYRYLRSTMYIYARTVGTDVEIQLASILEIMGRN